MTCRYCGLVTDGGVNHATSCECVAALKAEAERLVEKLVTTIRLPKPNIAQDPAETQSNAPAPTDREDRG